MMTSVIWLTLALALQAPPPNGGESEGAGIAAKINGEAVTWDEVELRLRSIRPDERTEELRHRELRRVAEDRLLLQFAELYKIKVSEQQVDEAIKRDKKLVGEERFEDFLRFRKQTLAEYRDEKRKGLLISHLERRMTSEAYRNPNYRTTLLYETVTPKELREYYKGHPEQFTRVNHISVWRIALKFTNEEEKQSKRRLAESILRKLHEGSDFGVLAHYYSDVVSTEAGGKKFPGYRELKREGSPFGEETTKLLFDTLKEGETTAVVEDGNSWNIFKLEQKVDKPEETFEEAQLKIRAQIESSKREENRGVLKQELVRQSFIEPSDLFRQ